MTAFTISLILGVPVGSLAAVHRNSRLDAVLTGVTSIGLAIPAFWLGLMLILLFAVTLHARERQRSRFSAWAVSRPNHRGATC